MMSHVKKTWMRAKELTEIWEDAKHSNLFYFYRTRGHTSSGLVLLLTVTFPLLFASLCFDIQIADKCSSLTFMTVTFVDFMFCRFLEKCSLIKRMRKIKYFMSHPWHRAFQVTGLSELLMLKSSVHIWHLAVTSEKPREGESDIQTEGASLLLLQDPRYLSGGLGRLFRGTVR